MSNRFPLQPADRSFDPSVNRGSTIADRRADDQNPYSDDQPGANAAPSLGAPMDLRWTPGTLAPDPFHQAPFAPIYMEGDSSGDGTVVHEVDTCSYGDDYDPTSPMRVREVGRDWSLDTDRDGEVN